MSATKPTVQIDQIIICRRAPGMIAPRSSNFTDGITMFKSANLWQVCRKARIGLMSTTLK
jgi:hypothetical protein